MQKLIFEKAVNKVISKLCAKSKKICSICETAIVLKEEISTTGRFTVISVDLIHPKYKSKKYRVCGNCYSDIRRSTSRVPKN